MFYNMPTRKPLSAEEVSYWKTSMRNIIKAGFEFEFNLPEKKNGTCNENSDTCPCKHLNAETMCWQKCINTEICGSLIKNTTTCNNVTGTCTDEDCATCEHFSKCSGIFCPNFVGSCYTCKDFARNCQDCKYKYDPNKNPDAIRQALQDELIPSNSYGKVSRSGVHSITTDGSLLGKKGAEVITVGRRINYWEFYTMTKNIMDRASIRGAYLNERCSTHMHILASYYDNIASGSSNGELRGIPAKVSEMERPLPEIVLANLHQLVRRYQNAMTWMTMGLDEQERMTRWEKFRVSVIPISAATSHMRDVQAKVSSHAGGTKYGWINYNMLGFDQSGDVNRFHVEFRAADGMMSPSAIAAIACMYYALVIKAIEISKYGVLEVGDEAWLARANTIKSAMMNNMKDYKDGDRFSDTSHLKKHYNILIEESLDLTRQLKAILTKVGPAYDVLEKLAERPIALRRIDGDNWEKIEGDLKVITTEEDEFEIALSEVIMLNKIHHCENMTDWVGKVSKFVVEDKSFKFTLAGGVTLTDIEQWVHEFIRLQRDDGKLIWSSKIGAPLLLN